MASRIKIFVNRIIDKVMSTPLARVVVEKAATVNVEAIVNQATNDAIEFAENHPVSKEIRGGIDSKNISGTLGGKGNLFSFIGFEFDSDPIGEFMDVFRGSVKITKKKSLIRRRTIGFQATIDQEKIFSGTPMPWENGRSWVRGIGKGISGFSQYLYFRFDETSKFNEEKLFEISRSEGGIQIKNRKLRSGTFKRTKYLSQIINVFNKSIARNKLTK